MFTKYTGDLEVSLTFESETPGHGHKRERYILRGEDAVTKADRFQWRLAFSRTKPGLYGRLAVSAQVGHHQESAIYAQVVPADKMDLSRRKSGRMRWCRCAGQGWVYFRWEKDALTDLDVQVKQIYQAVVNKWREASVQELKVDEDGTVVLPQNWQPSERGHGVPTYLYEAPNLGQTSAISMPRTAPRYRQVPVRFEGIDTGGIPMRVWIRE